MKLRWTVLGCAIAAAGVVGCGPSCPEGQEMCDGVCADLTVDRNHCGACGNVCGAGEICDGAGSCELSCASGLTDCDGSCTDLDVDGSNCGACGTACGAGEVCDGAGACALTCSDDLTDCSGTCVDTDGDEANCGGCGTACDDGESCVSGSCAPTCGIGLIACGGGCVDPMTDASYCGASSDCSGGNAGDACGTSQACAGGACVDIAACSLPPASGTPGVTVGTASATAIEGGEAVTYTVVLGAQPCDNVYLTLAADAQLRVEPAMLAFTPQNWNTAQTVTVWAVADAALEGDHTGTVGHTAASGDAAYEAITVGDATVSISDRLWMWHATAPVVPGDDDTATLGGVSNDGVVAFSSGATNLVADDENGALDAFTYSTATGAVRRWSRSATGVEGGDDTSYATISADGTTVVFFSLADNLTSTTTAAGGEIFRVSDTRPIAQVTSVCTGGCTGTEISGTQMDVSTNGSVIAFTTRRTYLPVADNETEYDIYVYTEGAALTLDSLNGADQNGTFYWGSNSFGPHLSSNGLFVTFNSAATNLATPEITVQNFHAYVKNRTTRALTRTSLQNASTDPCLGSHQVSSSSSPYVSGDGNVAAFHTACAMTLASGTDDNGVTDVVVRNISAMTTTRVSVATDGTQADDASQVLGITDDGNQVLFWSDATNLVADDTNGARDLFVHDIAAGTTVRVSLAPDFSEIPDGIATGVMSRDGSFVAFTTSAALLPSDLDLEEDIYVVAMP